jgi:hypothetical protein
MADERGEILGIDDSVGNALGGYPHVFKTLHWCSEVEVFDVGNKHSCIVGGYGAVEEEFYDGDVG